MPDKGTLQLARPVFHIRDSLNRERMVRQVRRGICLIGTGALQETLEEAGHAVRIKICPYHDLEANTVRFLLRAAREFQLIRNESGLAPHHDCGRASPPELPPADAARIARRNEPREAAAFPF